MTSRLSKKRGHSRGHAKTTNHSYKTSGTYVEMATKFEQSISPAKQAAKRAVGKKGIPTGLKEAPAHELMFKGLKGSSPSLTNTRFTSPEFTNLQRATCLPVNAVRRGPSAVEKPPLKTRNSSEKKLDHKPGS